MSARGYWFAFSVGVAAGAAVALLYAPESGVRTRKRIRRGLDDSAEYLEDAAEYLKEQAEELTRQARETIKQAKGQVDDAVDKAVDAVSGTAKNIRALM